MSKAFFDSIKMSLFGGHLTDAQVGGLNVILAEWQKRGGDDLRHLAYMLATVFHECNRTMQPISELGGTAYFTKHYEGRADLGNVVAGDGAKFHGRGYVQITGRRNYLKASGLVGDDLIAHPELALRPDYAAAIMFDGMEKGWFTGKKLSDYVNANECDYRQARKIINGLDRAALIAGYASDFEAALKLHDALAPVDATPASPPSQPDMPAVEAEPAVAGVSRQPDEPQPQPAPARPTGILAGLIALLKALFGRN